jgi:hypothetical protein
MENLDGPTCELKDEVQFFVNEIPKPSCLANLMSMPQLLARKTKGVEPLVDNNQSHIVTSK